MSKFKKGDVVEVVVENGGVSLRSKWIVNEDDSDMPYCFPINGGVRVVIHENYLKLLTGLDALKVGDVVVYKDTNERTVLGICGSVYFFSNVYDKNSYGSGSTIQQLKDVGYTPKNAPQESKEYSMDEIAKALNVSVADLKIKKD